MGIVRFWSRTSIAVVADAQLPGETREEIRKYHGDLPGGARGGCPPALVFVFVWFAQQPDQKRLTPPSPAQNS